MKKCSTIILLILLSVNLSLVLPQNIMADDNEDKLYFDMSLEDLMGINVVTASSFNQKVSEASAIIDVYTAEQIKDLGADNLYDFLSFLPGIEIMETYYGYTDVQFRGILQSHYNNKSSLLLNGQPLYDGIISSYYLEQVPLSAIDQVEVIRGPGSVLYGTNAYAGVINIITRDGKSMNGSSFSIKGGSFYTKNASFAIGSDIDGIDLFLGGEYNNSDGYERTIIWDEDDDEPESGLNGEQPYGNRILGYYPDANNNYENDYTNFFGSLGYRDFELNAVFFESKKDKFGIIPTLSSTGERLVRGFSLNARYNNLFLDEKALIRSIVWHDRITKDERVNSYPPVVRADGVPHDQEYGGYKSGFQTQLSYPFGEKLDLLGGVGYEDSHSDPYLFLYTDSVSSEGGHIQNLAANAITEDKYTNDAWAFIQASMSPFRNFNIQAGGRFNKNKQAGSVFVPSLGAVYRPIEKLAVKVLYGKGFRNPSFFEKYVSTIDVLAGDESLVPEHINTFEFGLDYSFSKYSIRANTFYMQTDKMIERRALTSEELDNLNSMPGYGTEDMTWSKGFVYYNSEGGKYRGVELSFQGIPRPGLSFQGNLTYKTGEDNDGNKLKYFAPFHANFALRYSPAQLVNFTLTLQHVAERDGNYTAKAPWQSWATSETGGTDYTLDSYNLLNARIGVKPTPPVEISVIIKNILDKEYNYPEYIRQSIPFIPGGPGRSLFVEVGYWL
jgi:outer membrane cobalamin receptor